MTFEGLLQAIGEHLAFSVATDHLYAVQIAVLDALVLIRAKACDRAQTIDHLCRARRT